MALFNTNKAQLLFYQDTYKGGISVDGKSNNGFDVLQPDTVVFQNTIPVGSTLKKAYLISLYYIFNTGIIPSKINSLSINFNNTSLPIDSSNEFNSFTCRNVKCRMLSKDVTNYTLFNNNKLIIPSQVLVGTSDNNYLYTGFLLVILYENSLMPATNASIFFSNNYINNPNTSVFSGLNPINNTKDVGLSIWIPDYSFSKLDSVGFTLNSTSYLGALYPRYNGFTKSLPGSFYYENNTLFGLVDDTPNPLIDSTDALANIKSYIANNATNLTLTTSNSINCEIGTYILAYSTPCPARSSADSIIIYTPICSGGTIQLHGASLGNYTWSTSNNSLNNYNISNPIATPTITTNYIALVDSVGCKRTEQHRVNVYTTPKTDSVATTLGICGGAHGTATIACNIGSPTSYTVNGMLQSSPTFNNLAAGTYTFAISNANGCSYTSPKNFTIKDTNLAKAFFYATPTSGCEPLAVSCTNLSNNPNNVTNNYVWYVNNDSATTQNLNYTFTDTGKYTIALLAYETFRNCSATFTQTITVKACPPDSFSIIIPNIFTPNGDDINETWQPTVYNYQFTVNNYSCVIYDRWGIKVFETNNIAEGWSGRSTSGTACSEGSYFYVLGYKATGSAGEVKEDKLKGFIELTR